MPVSRPVVDSAKAARHLRKRRADKPQVDKLRAVGATAGTALQLGELSELLGYALKRAQLKVFDDFLRCVAPLQLTPAPFSVLLLLDRNPGRNQSEITSTFGILQTHLGAILDVIGNHELGARIGPPSDRRSHIVVLTEKGRAVLA